MGADGGSQSDSAFPKKKKKNKKNSRFVKKREEKKKYTVNLETDGFVQSGIVELWVSKKLIELETKN